MSSLTHHERRKLEDLFGMSSGYVLVFPTRPLPCFSRKHWASTFTAGHMAIVDYVAAIRDPHEKYERVGRAQSKIVS